MEKARWSAAEGPSMTSSPSTRRPPMPATMATALAGSTINGVLNRRAATCGSILCRLLLVGGFFGTRRSFGIVARIGGDAPGRRNGAHQSAGGELVLFDRRLVEDVEPVLAGERAFFLKRRGQLIHADAGGLRLLDRVDVAAARADPAGAEIGAGQIPEARGAGRRRDVAAIESLLD